MKRYKPWILIILLICLNLNGCVFSGSELFQLSITLGADLSGAEILETKETHDDFLHDGITYYQIQIPDDQSSALTSALKKDEFWTPLPLTENLQAAIYGGEVTVSQGHPDQQDSLVLDPAGTVIYRDSFAKDSDGSCLFPEIEHGYYFFCNRQGSDPHKELDYLNSYSYNFTVAVFDTDTNLLYYFEYDS